MKVFRHLALALALLAPGVAWGQTQSGGGSSVATTATAGIIKPDGTTTTITTAGVLSSAASLLPTNRPPSESDDSTVGYAVGNLWLFGGKTWQAISVTAGAANWQLQPQTTAGPLQQVSGAAAAYATWKLSTSYAGNAFQITRQSDSTTLTVGFVLSGIADWASVDVFCSGTVCGVNTWYDQSGNGYNLTQATFANMPRVYGSVVGGLRSITFDGNLVNSPTFSRWLSNSSVPTSNVQNVSFVTTLRNYISSNSTTFQQGSGAAIVDIGYPTPVLTLYSNNASTVGLSLRNNGVSTATNSTLKTNAQVLSYVGASSGSAVITQNNGLSSVGNGVIAPSGATGLFLGGTTLTSTYPANMDVTSFVLYNNTLLSASLSLLQSALYKNAGVTPQGNDQLLFVGDSITRGWSASLPSELDTGPYANSVAALFAHPFNTTNIGVSSETASQMATEAPNWVNLAYVPGALNIVTVFGGTNDFSQSSTVTAAQVYASIQSICATYKAVGFKCVIATPLARNGSFSGGASESSFETQRQALITLMKNGWPSFADGIINTGSNPVMGPASAATNTALYPDGVHPSMPLGYSYVAADFAAGMNSIVPH